MKLLKSSLLGSAAALMAVGAGHAADLPVKKAVPIEFVRVCSTYGAGFFYIPGTDTCLRLSGRARAEMGYVSNENRAVGTQVGDVSQYRGLLRINLDARTQTEYGTLRAFIRADIASASGTYLTSGTRQRVSEAFPALGVDQFGRTQMYVNADKAFIQFAGLTAGRASSFFDFYAHDFEMVAGSAGSDVFSTNLLAYTATVGNGLSATISIEDPNYRHNNLFNAGVSTSGVIGTSSASIFGGSTAPTGLILATNANGATIVTFQDVIERSRLPDFVGVLRYDQAWGSAQLSAAAKDINIGGSGNANGLPSVLSTAAVGNVTAFQAQALAAARGISGGPKTTEGFAVQGGVKINMPFIAPGDALYLQGAYGLGANNYAGVAAYTGQYQVSATPTNGGPFQQYLADAVLNPLTGKIQLTEAFSVVGSYLHYWTPQWRSAFFASYSQTNFGKGARAAESLLVGNTLGTTTNGVFTASGGIGGGAASVISPVGNSAALYALSPVLRDNYQIYAGANLIWSPVKDLDIGAEGVYLNSGVLNGRVIDSSKTAGVTATNFNALAAAGAIKTVRSYDATQIRFRVQRDF